MHTIEELRSIISPIAEKHGVKSVSVFGSYARADMSARSDVDLKIEKGNIRSLFQLCDFRLAVEDALSMPVDVITSDSSDKEFLKTIARDEVVIYERA